jgi:hypothetical protein
MVNDPAKMAFTPVASNTVGGHVTLTVELVGVTAAQHCGGVIAARRLRGAEPVTLMIIDASVTSEQAVNDYLRANPSHVVAHVEDKEQAAHALQDHVKMHGAESVTIHAATDKDSRLVFGGEAVAPLEWQEILKEADLSGVELGISGCSTNRATIDAFAGMGKAPAALHYSTDATGKDGDFVYEGTIPQGSVPYQTPQRGVVIPGAGLIVPRHLGYEASLALPMAPGNTVANNTSLSDWGATNLSLLGQLVTAWATQHPTTTLPTCALPPQSYEKAVQDTVASMRKGREELPLEKAEAYLWKRAGRQARRLTADVDKQPFLQRALFADYLGEGFCPRDISEKIEELYAIREKSALANTWMSWAWAKIGNDPLSLIVEHYQRADAREKVRAERMSPGMGFTPSP